MDLAKAAPIFCAGITVYDPLSYHGYTQMTGKTVGIAGVGGLGTMGIKLAKALGHKVVAISSSAKKEAVAKEKGADFYVNITDPESVKAMEGKCHIILNTISADHDVNQYLPLLNKCGIISLLGLVAKPQEIRAMDLIFTRKSITSSIVGGAPRHQELIDLCFKHSIYPDIEVFEAKDMDKIWDTLATGDNKGLRFVLDVKKSLENKDFC